MHSDFNPIVEKLSRCDYGPPTALGTYVATIDEQGMLKFG